MISKLLLLRAVFLGSLNLPFIAVASQCYYPDAISQPRDTPCHPNARQSNCCAPEDICLSNGLCYRSNINRLHRGVSLPFFRIKANVLILDDSPARILPLSTPHALVFARGQTTTLMAGLTSLNVRCPRNGTAGGGINHDAKAETHSALGTGSSMIIGKSHIRAKRR